MYKTIKKILFSALSILGLSLTMWILLAVNPNLSYANKTQFDIVSVYHNDALDINTKKVILDAISIIKTSELYNDKTAIELCLNDDKLYPKLNPLVGNPFAYAMLNKTVFKNCTANFDENILETKWAENNFEHRKFNLTWTLAHEFTHNLQNQENFGYVFSSTIGHINWKLEGHAEYISRQFKGDGKLKEKISACVLEEKKEHIGFPVFELEDGSKQILSYFKYALVIQYLMEKEDMNYQQVCEDKRHFDELYQSMLTWSQQ